MGPILITAKLIKNPSKILNDSLIRIRTLHKSTFDTRTAVSKFLAAVILNALAPDTHLAFSMEASNALSASFWQVNPNSSVLVEQLHLQCCRSCTGTDNGNATNRMHLVRVRRTPRWNHVWLWMTMVWMMLTGVMLGFGIMDVGWKVVVRSRSAMATGRRRLRIMVGRSVLM